MVMVNIFVTLIICFFFLGSISGDYLQYDVDNITRKTRIVHGRQASYKQENVRYTVSIRSKFFDVPFGNGHICGGSLISRETVLTAAHCFFDGTGKELHTYALKVVGGHADLAKEGFPVFTSNVRSFAYHEGFSIDDAKDDVGVLNLDESVPADHPTLKPFPLASEFAKLKQQCTVAGWGYDNPKTKNQKLLMMTTLTVVDELLCALQFKDWAPSKKDLCLKDMKGQSNICAGDSGSGLLCKNTITGITTGTVKDCIQGAPIVFMHVPAYLDWIKNHSGSNRLFGPFLKFTFILCNVAIFLNYIF